MGVYLSKFVEYRTQDGKWHLFESYVPETEKNSDFFEDGEAVVTVGGKTLFRQTEYVEKHGYWLDFLYTGEGSSPFEDRGFPEDMSPELASILEKDKDNPDIHGRSWLTLKELWRKSEADKEKFRSDFESLNYETMLSATNTKLDRLQESLIALKTGGEIPPVGREKVNHTELYIGLNDLFNFDFERLVGEVALFHETRQLVINAQGYFSDYNIRIVYYLL